jgi:hypothetical protein
MNLSDYSLLDMTAKTLMEEFLAKKRTWSEFSMTNIKQTLSTLI